MKEVKVKFEPRWFVECPQCGAEFDVDAYETGKFECECGEKFCYDNSDLDKAEVV